MYIFTENQVLEITFSNYDVTFVLHSVTDPELEHEVSASFASLFFTFLMIFANILLHVVYESKHKIKMNRVVYLSFNILQNLGLKFGKMCSLTVLPFVHLGAQSVRYSTAGLSRPGFNECFVIAMRVFFSSFNDTD